MKESWIECVPLQQWDIINSYSLVLHFMLDHNIDFTIPTSIFDKKCKLPGRAFPLIEVNCDMAHSSSWSTWMFWSVTSGPLCVLLVARVTRFQTQTFRRYPKIQQTPENCVKRIFDSGSNSFCGTAYGDRASLWEDIWIDFMLQQNLTSIQDHHMAH